jgi:hypothetical protein
MRTKPLVVFSIVVLALTSMACLGATVTGGVTAIPPAAPTVTVAPSATIAPTAAPAPSPTAVTYSAPEDAITAYFDGVARSDARQILQACAINEMAEKFHFDLYTSYLGGYFNPITTLAPATYPFYVESNRAQLSEQISTRVRLFDYSLLSSKVVLKDNAINPLTGLDPAAADAFVKDVDPQRLASIKLEKIAPPDPSVLNSDRNKQNAAKMAAIYGADESTERVALFSFEGQEYVAGFTLLRYGQDWKISAQVSPLSGQNSQGAAQPTTQSDFQDLITR